MVVMLARLLCSACFIYTSIGRLQGATLEGLLCPLQLLASLLCKAYFAKVTWHAQSPGELTICEAYFVRLALCVLNLLGDANSARLTLCVLVSFAKPFVELG
jgi:hypothetical protein